MIWPAFDFKKKSLAGLNSRRDLKDQIRKARILVIDDDPNAFPVELLKTEGYNVTYWDSLRTLTPLETGDYDIIILDLNGIAAPNQSSQDGIGVLRHIKGYNPSQIVVAYSAKKYDFRQGDFWKIADDYLGKPSPLDACKQKIDELLQSKFNIDYYWGILRAQLIAESVSEKKLKKLEDLIVRKSEQNKTLTAEEFSGIIKVGKESLSASVVILGIIGKLIGNA